LLADHCGIDLIFGGAVMEVLVAFTTLRSCGTGSPRAGAALWRWSGRYFGRGQAILQERGRIKRQTIQQRRLLHQQQAA
jgi:hypothetical protein